MSQVRHAAYRHLRGLGWIVVFPLAALLGVIVKLVSDSDRASFTAAIALSLVGLVIVSFGILLGDLWGGYWMIPVALGGGEIAWLVAIWEGSWVKVLIGTAAVVLSAAMAAAIGRTSGESGGIARLLGCFVQSLIPGCYRGRRR